MDSGTEATVWEETTGSAARLVQHSTGSQALSTDIAPIADTPENRQMFAKAIAPALTLVAPVGMRDQDKRDWFSAAWRALSHLPADLIASAARQALGKADHPSKIVPAVLAAAQDDLAWRHRMRERPAPVPHLALPAPGAERPTTHEIDAICKRFFVGRYAKAAAKTPRDAGRPTETKGGTGTSGRTPTREDYIRLGVDPAVLDGASV